MVSEKLFNALMREREIELVVKGRKTGRNLPRPVWFVVRGGELLLLPVTGTSTQWYRNVLKNPEVKISVADQAHTGKVLPIKDKKGVADVVELFRNKYGAGDVKRYYPKTDAATRLPLT